SEKHFTTFSSPGIPEIYLPSEIFLSHKYHRHEKNDSYAKNNQGRLFTYRMYGLQNTQNQKIHAKNSNPASRTHHKLSFIFWRDPAGKSFSDHGCFSLPSQKESCQDNDQCQKDQYFISCHNFSFLLPFSMYSFILSNPSFLVNTTFFLQIFMILLKKQESRKPYERKNIHHPFNGCL